MSIIKAEDLLPLISQNEAVYNPNCPEYRDLALRNQTWEEIARQLGHSVDDVKEAWNKLRNCYYNAIKRRIKKSNRKEKKLPPWRYEREMAFLKPHVFGLNNEDGDDVDLKDSTKYFENPLPSPECQMVSNESNYSRASTPLPNKSYKRKASPDNYMVEVLKSSHDTSKIHEMDDIDVFFISMCKSLKKLPKLDQIRIKMELHKSISEAEIKQLKKNRNNDDSD